MDKKNKSLNTQTIFIVTIVVIFLLFFTWLCYSNKDNFLNLFERFIGERLSVNGNEFQKIGYGPAIDETIIRYGDLGTNSWLSTSDTIQYQNHEGIIMSLTNEEFKSINGFIPPSIEFFPYGVNNPEKEYKPTDTDFPDTDTRFASSNVEEGRAACFQACKDTGCVAVQTEVPQNCYNRRITIPVPEGLSVVGNEDAKYMVSKNDCKGKATHGCTLFYQNIMDADDAYYTLAGGEEGFNDPTIPLKVGQKYYEMNPLPEISPSVGPPSSAEVKFCDAKITVGDRGEGGSRARATRYKTVTDEPDCDCTDINCNHPACCPCLPKYSGNTLVTPAPLECEDSRCCLYRDLLTTEFAKHNTPYYSLPLNLTKTKDLEQNNLGALCDAQVVVSPDDFNKNEYLPIILGNPYLKKSVDFRDYWEDIGPTILQILGINSNDLFPQDAPGERLNCCGWCEQYDGSFRLRSCPSTRQYIDGTRKNVNGGLQSQKSYWHINTSNCAQPDEGLSGVWGEVVDWFESSNDTMSDEECIENYQENYNSNRELAYEELTKCCTFMDQACQAVAVQPFCRSGGGDVERGCYSDPPILNVDSLQGNIIAADSSLIPGSQRCVQDVDGKLCKGFPYGVSEKSGALWKPL